MKRTLALLLIPVFLTAFRGTAAAEQVRPESVPEAKQTVLGLYLTATEAYRKWRADPENVTIIDVRTPEEYVFIGHPEMAWNVPLKLLVKAWDPKTGKPVLKDNPDFVAQVREFVRPEDTVLVTCRSGQRSGPAVNLLAKAGFKNAYSIIDGFEGDKVDDPDSVFDGKRMKNGWKNAGLPWTYKVDPERMVLNAP